MENLEVKISFEESLNASLAFVNNEQAGICNYIVEGDKWNIVHTRVKDEFGGRGIAKKLVLKIIEEARKRNIKIKPTCSYAVKMMDNPEYQGILDK